MAYKQRVAPIVPYSVWFGQCLMQVRSAFKTPAAHPSATQGANATKLRRTTRKMPTVAVPVWFDHWGTYGSPARYANWGHVVLWVPSVGKFMSSPIGRQSPGYTWYNSIEEVERFVGAKFRFWSLDINGVTIAEEVADPKPTPKPTPSSKGTIVKNHYQRRDKTANGSGKTSRVMKPGTTLYLNERNAVTGSATNVVGGIGYYSITPHIYIKGTAGDKATIKLVWQDTKAKNPSATNSAHYQETIALEFDGHARRSVEFKRYVSAGYAVYVHVEAHGKNKGNIEVTLLASDAYLFG